MSWTSSTAIIGQGTNGVLSTTSNNALIKGDWANDYLEVYGSDDTVLASGGSDSIGVVMYPALGMNGTKTSLNGDYGNDILVAAAIQGEQYATLVGGHGVDSYGFGCNSDSTINVIIADLDVNNEYIGVFYEGYGDGIFTCYTSDKGFIVRDNAGRLNVTLSGVSDYNTIMNYGRIWVYPQGVRRESGGVVAETVWYNGQWKNFSTVANYGGYLSGVTITDNSIVLNDYHNGGVLTNGVYGLDNIITIDNSQCRDARFLGGNAQNNYIFAGAGGDTLWGAAGNDVLVGGAGADNFVYNAGEGADLFLQTNWLDTVTLNDLTLNNIAVFAQGDAIAVAADANNSAVIQYNGVYSPLIKLADGSAWRYKSDDATWINF